MTLERCGLAIVVAALLAACGCGGGGEVVTASWAKGAVSIDGESYDVQELEMELELGEDGYYGIFGVPSSDGEEDCVPGLSPGLSFYGPVPVAATAPEHLSGKRVRLEFSGDGDDANLCFKGMDGLLGATDAWLTFEEVEGDRVAFTMAGRFELYDGDGTRAPRPLEATARGTAQITEIWN